MFCIELHPDIYLFINDKSCFNDIVDIYIFVRITVLFVAQLCQLFYFLNFKMEVKTNRNAMKSTEVAINGTETNLYGLVEKSNTRGSVSDSS